MFLCFRFVYVFISSSLWLLLWTGGSWCSVLSSSSSSGGDESSGDGGEDGGHQLVPSTLESLKHLIFILLLFITGGLNTTVVESNWVHLLYSTFCAFTCLNIKIFSLLFSQTTTLMFESIFVCLSVCLSPYLSVGQVSVWPETWADRELIRYYSAPSSGQML